MATATPKSDRRLYVVQPHARDAAGNDLKPRLVEAPNTAQALRHVAADSFDVHIPTQTELVKLVQMGVKVEQSGAAALAEAAQRDQQALPAT